MLQITTMIQIIQQKSQQLMGVMIHMLAYFLMAHYTILLVALLPQASDDDISDVYESDGSIEMVDSDDDVGYMGQQFQVVPHAIFQYSGQDSYSPAYTFVSEQNEYC